MKRIVFAALLILCVSLIFTSCGGDVPARSGDTSPVSEQPAQPSAPANSDPGDTSPASEQPAQPSAPEVIYELTSASVDLPRFSQDDMNAVIEKADGRVAVISASETDDGLRASVRYFDAAEPTRIVNSAKSGIIDVDRCYFDGVTYAWMFLPDGTLYGLMTGELAASSDYDESWVGGYFGIKGVWSSDGNGFTAESSYAVLPAEVAGIMSLF